LGVGSLFSHPGFRSSYLMLPHCSKAGFTASADRSEERFQFVSTCSQEKVSGRSFSRSFIELSKGFEVWMRNPHSHSLSDLTRASSIAPPEAFLIRTAFIILGWKCRVKMYGRLPIGKFG
jgi:hypothetical protein